MVYILPISASKNPRRSLTSQFDMARTKDRTHFYRAKKANELAAVAQCMDNYLRTTNEELERKVQLQQLNFKTRLNAERLRADGLRQIQAQRHRIELQNMENAYTRMLMRRQRRIRELENQWEDMSQTLFDAIEENEKLRKKVKNMEEQLLDCSCFEKIDLSDNETE